MKTLLAVMGLVLFAIPAWGQDSADATGRPKLTIDRTDHNFGEINRTDSPTHTFTFKNTGTAELRITNVAPS
ncbi:MAG: DUF1573 domain-containing protein [Acidobacteria bacterium]|nr:DUF1573 domain-containing protein [Acidobacteriota bacterium]